MGTRQTSGHRDVRLRNLGAQISESVNSIGRDQLRALLDADQIRYYNSYVSRLEKPSPEVVHTFLAKGRTVDYLVEVGERIIDKYMKDLPAVFSEVEDLDKGNFGPQTPLPPWFDDSVQTIFNKATTSGDHEKGFKYNSRELFPELKLRPTSFEESLAALDLSTNSGWPWFGRRSRFVQPALKLARLLLQDGDPVEPIYLYYSRSKTTDEGLTRRTVWGASMIWNLVEGRFVLPLMTNLKRYPIFSTWRGLSAVEDYIYRLWNNIGNDYIVSWDASSFDANVGVVQLADLEKWLFDVFDELTEEERRALEATTYGFNYKWIMSPDGMKFVRGGVPSGHRGTNAFDSVLNLMGLESCFGRAVSRSPLVNGDDLIFTAGVEEIDRGLAEYDTLGWEVNPNKQVISRDYCLFNSRYHFQGKKGSLRTFWRAWRGLCYPERDPVIPVGQGGHALIAVMKLETLWGHPAWKDTVDHVIEADTALGLGTFSDKAFRKLLNSAADVKEGLRIGSKDDGYRGSEVLDGFQNWHTIRYLRETLA